jgi:hypothetical protein
VSSMLESPVSALYHSLHKVYSPILLKDSAWSHEFDPKLQVKKDLGPYSQHFTFFVTFEWAL